MTAKLILNSQVNMPKATVEAYSSIDMKFFTKAGVCGSNNDVSGTYKLENKSELSFFFETHDKCVQFAYRVNSKNFNVWIKIQFTPCFFGGERYWFLCPFCESSRRILYLSPFFIACRRCLNLGYESQKYDAPLSLWGNIQMLSCLSRQILDMKYKYYGMKETKKFAKLSSERRALYEAVEKAKLSYKPSYLLLNPY